MYCKVSKPWDVLHHVTVYEIVYVSRRSYVARVVESVVKYFTFHSGTTFTYKKEHLSMVWLVLLEKPEELLCHHDNATTCNTIKDSPIMPE